MCDNGWDINEATVVCRLLGYNGMVSLVVVGKDYLFSPGFSVAYTSAYFGPSNGSVLLTGLGCNGNETSLFMCSHSNSLVGTTGCLHSNDAGVNCSYG